MLFQYYPVSTGYGRGVFQTLVDWGILDAILPFILIWILIFAILQKVKVFGEGEAEGRKGDRKINGILGLVISAMVVIPHVVGLYPPESDPIIIINQFLPSAAIVLIAILLVIMLLGLAGGEIPNLVLWVVALVALAFLIFMIVMAVVPSYWPGWWWLRDPSIQALVIILLVMGLIAFFVIREPSSEEGFGDWVKTWLGKP